MFGISFRNRPNAYSVKDDPILLSYLSMIDVRTRWLQNQSGELDVDDRAILGEIESLRAELVRSSAGTYTESLAWIEAYRLERLMALLEPLPNLIPEIRLRLDEARAETVSAEPRLRAAFTAAEATAVDKSLPPPSIKQGEELALRALLLEILEETHWTNQRKFYIRPIQVSATRRIAMAGILSFCLFILPYVYIYGDLFWHAIPTIVQKTGADCIDVDLAAAGVATDCEWKIPKHAFVGLPFFTALSAGLFGAYFSRLLFIQSNAGIMSVGEMKTARELTSILLRGIVGMCGALVMFIFLRSGMVNGKLFPQFPELNIFDGQIPMQEMLASQAAGGGAKIETIRQILPSPALALLAIWCFLAGFSERLVPSILSTTEKTLGNAAKGVQK